MRTNLCRGTKRSTPSFQRAITVTKSKPFQQNQTRFGSPLVVENIGDIDELRLFPCRNADEAARLERRMIFEFQPYLNVVGIKAGSVCKTVPRW